MQPGQSLAAVWPGLRTCYKKRASLKVPGGAPERVLPSGFLYHHWLPRRRGSQAAGSGARASGGLAGAAPWSSKPGTACFPASRKAPSRVFTSKVITSKC